MEKKKNMGKRKPAARRRPGRKGVVVGYSIFFRSVFLGPRSGAFVDLMISLLAVRTSGRGGGDETPRVAAPCACRFCH